MPDSDVARMIAVVPVVRGANSSSTAIRISASLPPVSSISLTEPIRRPPIWTSSSVTSWPAFWKRRR